MLNPNQKHLHYGLYQELALALTLTLSLALTPPLPPTPNPNPNPNPNPHPNPLRLPEFLKEVLLHHLPATVEAAQEELRHAGAGSGSGLG